VLISGVLHAFLLIVIIWVQKELTNWKQMYNQTTDDPTKPEPTPSTGASTLQKAATTLGVLLLLGSAGAAGYFYKQYDSLKKNPNKVAQDETKSLIDSVAKLIVLPSNEQPTVATVTDPAKLKDQAFFANAKAGDKVLIYTNARKAILYSPSANQIVEVAPVNIGNNTATQSTVSGTSTDNQTDPKK
jgi:hypothetical protein